MDATNLLIEIAEHAWMRSVTHNSSKNDKPGEYLARLPQEIRDKLCELKSDDLRKIRFDAIKDMCHPSW